jgi:hypothetical protein
MSLISLRSNNLDNPGNFSNSFKEGVKIKKNDLVELVSIGIVSTKKYNIVKDLNDTIVWRIGSVGVYTQQTVKIPDGSYDAVGLSSTLQKLLNKSTVIGLYRGTWLVSFDITNDKFKILYSQNPTPTENANLVNFTQMVGTQNPIQSIVGTTKNLKFPIVEPNEYNILTDVTSYFISDRGLFSNGGENVLIVKPLKVINSLTDLIAGDFKITNWQNILNNNITVALTVEIANNWQWKFTEGGVIYYLYFNLDNGVLGINTNTLNDATINDYEWTLPIFDLDTVAKDLIFTEDTADDYPMNFLNDDGSKLKYDTKLIYPPIVNGFISNRLKPYFDTGTNSDVIFLLDNNIAKTELEIYTFKYNFKTKNMQSIKDVIPWNPLNYGFDSVRIKTTITGNTSITLSIAYDTGGNGIFSPDEVITSTADAFFNTNIQQQNYPLYGFNAISSGSLLEEMDVVFGGIYDTEIIPPVLSVFSNNIEHIEDIDVDHVGLGVAPELSAIFKMRKLETSDIFDGNDTGAGANQVGTDSVFPNIGNLGLLFDMKPAYNFQAGADTNNIESDNAVITSFSKTNLHLEVSEFNIKSYNGATADSTKDIFVIPKAKWENYNDIYGQLFFSPLYPIPIKTNLSNDQIFFNLGIRLRDPDGKIENDLLNPTEIVLKITSKD